MMAMIISGSLFVVYSQMLSQLKDIINLSGVNIEESSYSNIYDAIINNEFEFLTKEIKEEAGKTYIGLKSIF